MKNTRALIFVLGLALFLPSRAQAQDNLWQNATRVTVTEAMQVPGTVLQPGQYVFRLDESNANRHIVHIFNADESKLVTTVLAIPNERLEPTDKGIMTYAERPVGEPVALEAWFYSGRTGGQQFVYPKSKAETLSRLNKVEVPSTGTEEAYPQQTASSNSRSPEPVYSASARSASNTPAPSSTVPVAPSTSQSTRESQSATNGRQATPAQQGSDADRSTQPANRLPATASVLPLLGAFGSLLLVAALLLKLNMRA